MYLLQSRCAERFDVWICWSVPENCVGGIDLTSWYQSCSCFSTRIITFYKKLSVKSRCLTSTDPFSLSLLQSDFFTPPPSGLFPSISSRWCRRWRGPSRSPWLNLTPLSGWVTSIRHDNANKPTTAGRMHTHTRAETRAHIHNQECSSLSVSGASGSQLIKLCYLFTNVWIRKKKSIIK